MIAYIIGKLTHKDPAYVIVEANGIGYQVRVSLNTYGHLKSESVKLFTYLMIKEDSHTLFGFKEMGEKRLFVQLIGISGVGGNTAMTILSGMTPDEFYQVIEGEDVAALKRVKGIGAKTAGRIILELKGKLVTGESGTASPLASIRSEAISALTGLGLPKASMEKKVDAILKSGAKEMTVETLIKEALKQK